MPDESPAANPSQSKDIGDALSIALVVLVLALAVALRVVACSADPPHWLSWSAGIYSDEGIYSEDARLWALYGQHMQGNFHASIIAPLWNVLLVHIFRKYGISLVKLRMISVAISIAALAIFGHAARVWYDKRTAVVATLLLAVSAPFVLYNRLGLMESGGVLLLALAFLALALAERAEKAALIAICLPAAGVFAGAAVAWKAIFALGAAGFAIYALWRHRAIGVVFLVGAAAAVGAYAALWYMPHHAELARMGRYYITHQYLPHSVAALWFNIHRNLATGEDDGLLPYLVKFAPILLIFAVYAMFPKVRSGEDRLAWLWLLVPCATMLFMSYAPSRYYLIFWPALALLAARGMTHLPRSLFRFALAAAVAVDGIMLGASYMNRTFTVHYDSRILQKALPPDAWIAGQFAPSLCLDNSLRSMYVQKYLANTPTLDTLRNLPVTHVLATETASPSADPWQGAYGDLIAAPAGLKTLKVGGKFVVGVYANKDALP